MGADGGSIPDRRDLVKTKAKAELTDKALLRELFLLCALSKVRDSSSGKARNGLLNSFRRNVYPVRSFSTLLGSCTTRMRSSSTFWTGPNTVTGIRSVDTSKASR